jgi:para-aminobenzoate synthetase component 1
MKAPRITIQAGNILPASLFMKRAEAKGKEGTESFAFANDDVYFCRVNQGKFFSTDTSEFREKAMTWASRMHDVFCVFDSNGYDEPPMYARAHACLMAIGVSRELLVQEAGSGQAFERLKRFHEKSRRSVFGFLSYDLKNDVENLLSENTDHLNFPAMYFFEPTVIISIEEGGIRILAEDAESVFREVSDEKKFTASTVSGVNTISHRTDRETYMQRVEAIRSHIIRGDIYEMNYCMEFYAEDAHIDPVHTYRSLCELSGAPFSACFKKGGLHLISASPERFMKKEGNRITSQPMKGTIRRGRDNEEDVMLKAQLSCDEKERSENIMIADLVRNDLSHHAVPGSVKVGELCGVYTFAQVHQMITTVNAEMERDAHFIDVIKNAFPMGSMTGAPKKRAMELIEQFENMKRGLYSGAVGYITPDGDFDFNVVIRSILYHADKRYLSFITGSAITYHSDAGREYEECMLKARSMMQVLQGS